MSVKKNFIYSSILTTSQYIFPLLTYPYVSRVLGVTNIGTVNYIDSIINYFILFSMLGMSVIGIREIASSNKGRKELSNTFWGLLTLNGLTTFIALICLIFCIYFVSEFYQYRNLLYIGIIKLVGNFFLIDWFYKGIENFKYITNRTILIKFAYVAAVFLFIHSKDDYNLYFLLSVLTIGVNAIFNIGYVFRFIDIKGITLNIKKYIKAFFSMGLYQILTSMYSSFNVAFLGWVVSTTQVGYYTTATKIYGLILAIYGAFTGVMLPRMSSLLSEKKIDEFKSYVEKSTNLMLIINIPIILFGIVYAKQIIGIVAGGGYEGAIVPFQITMVLMLLVGYDQIQVIQVLMPMKDDKAILTNSFVGAIIGILANFLLVPYCFSTGSALVLVISELAVLITARIFVKRHMDIKFPFRLFCREFIFHIPLLIVLILINYILNFEYLAFAISAIITCLYVFLLQYSILKNELIVGIVYAVLKRKNGVF